MGVGVGAGMEGAGLGVWSWGAGPERGLQLKANKRKGTASEIAERRRTDFRTPTGPNDIEFSGEKEGAQRLTPSPLQRGVGRRC